MLLYLFFVSYRTPPTLVAISLSDADRQTMEWVKENTPPKSRFLLITNRGEISPMTDSYQEWFPALAERQSPNTLQGSEWTLGPHFFPYSQKLVALQACPDVDCLDKWLAENHIQVDFVLFQKKRVSQSLIDSLRGDQQYALVYESPNTDIYALRH
jgi:hypothetical protein